MWVTAYHPNVPYRNLGALKIYFKFEFLGAKCCLDSFRHSNPPPLLPKHPLDAVLHQKYLKDSFIILFNCKGIGFSD